VADGSSSEVFARGLDFLGLIAESRYGLSIEQLAECRGMHRSSIYRYISPLLERAYIKKTSDSRYELGPKVLELASMILERLDIRNVAHPLLIELSERTATTVHLAQLDGTEIVYLDKVETRRSLPIVSRIGGRQPVHCTGLGKALLAFLPQQRLDELLPKIEFRVFTPATIPDEKCLVAELAVIRARGYALDNQEHEPGISCVAFPIFDLYKEPIGAVSATARTRDLDGKLDFYITSVQQAANEISAAFGHRASSGLGESSRRRT